MLNFESAAYKCIQAALLVEQEMVVVQPDDLLYEAMKKLAAVVDNNRSWKQLHAFERENRIGTGLASSNRDDIKRMIGRILGRKNLSLQDRATVLYCAETLARYTTAKRKSRRAQAAKSRQKPAVLRSRTCP